MANSNPTANPLSNRAGVIVLALFIILGDASQLAASDEASEARRRSEAVSEAMMLLRKGDEAYLDTDYLSAVEAFAGARELIPNAPASAELYLAATDRFVTASIEHARELSRRGDLQSAKQTMARVLDPAVAPEHPAAVRMLAELEDPVRHNPALTRQHAQDVDEVRRTLYLAEGAYNLGKFDEANRHYSRVLQIDPHNRAARRGMERVTQRLTDYQQTAFDHTRSEMFSQIDAQWETSPPIRDEIPDQPNDGSVFSGTGASTSLLAKINRILIPTFQVEQATLQEALDLLRARAREHDTLESDPVRRGLNINLIAGEDASDLLGRRINLQLANASVAAILGYLCDATSTDYTTDEFSVVIRPLASHRDEVITRTFRVPPDFLSALSSGAATAAAPDDPFAPAPQAGLLPQRLGIREALEANGIEFIEGTSASLSQNVLRVTHTAAALEIIDGIVNTLAQSEPVSVITRVKIIRVQERTLTELGFDWLLGSFKLGGGSGEYVGVGGGTQGNQGILSDLDPILIAPGMGPITAGNRSGDQAITSSAFLNGFAASEDLRAERAFRAPGILSVSGVMNNTTAQMVLRGLDQKSGVDIMNQPSVVTANGQAATVRVIREFFYPTSYSPPQIPQTVVLDGVNASPVIPSTPEEFEMREVGLLLDVLPLADASRNYVEITISPNFTDFQGFINYGTPINSTVVNPGPGAPPTVEIAQNAILQPVFSVSRVNTSVTVADGATVVLGGLLQSRFENVQDQTPILGDIPLVGRLFQTKASQPVRTALIFFVTVELVDPTGRPYRSR